MRNLKVKIIAGFRKDQHYTIDADEAHKAYYLFLNPEKRGIFKNGVAIIGQDIRGIEPDWNATMGWNPDHVLLGDDWNEIRRDGVDDELRKMLVDAKMVSAMPEMIGKPLSEAMQLIIANPSLQLK